MAHVVVVAAEFMQVFLPLVELFFSKFYGYSMHTVNTFHYNAVIPKVDPRYNNSHIIKVYYSKLFKPPAKKDTSPSNKLYGGDKRMKKILGTKGQANNAIVQGMLLLLIVAVIGIVAVTVYASIASSLGADLTGAASAAKENFSENFYDGTDLASNIPIVIAAGLLLSVIMAFALYMRA